MRFHPTSRCTRIIAALLGLFLLTDVLHPTVTWALTSGPAQPEFTSFEPVVTTTMVNEFTGDLTYNLPVLQIPGPDGGGYALSLSYHSGVTPEEEASWVGAGWTLNPGSISRQMKGIPDDWNGKPIKHFNKAPASKTVSIAGNYMGPEITSYDIPVGANTSIRYNNYTGFGYSAGLGFKFCQGVVSLGFQVSDGQSSFSLTVNPGELLSKKIRLQKEDVQNCKEEQVVETDNSPDCIAEMNASVDRAKEQLSESRARNAFSSLSMSSNYGLRNIVSPAFPQALNEMNGLSHQLSVGLNITFAPFEGGMITNLSGRYAEQINTPLVSRDAYGYLHSENADNARSSMDYHADHANTYNKRDKFLPLPVADADGFMATGEGVMGSMRFYSARPAMYRPAATESRTQMVQIGVELNAAMNNGAGADVGIGDQRIVSGAWPGGPTTMSDPLDEPFTLRMVNDKGGMFAYTSGDAPTNASINTSGATGYRSGSYDQGYISSSLANDGARSGRSSHVGYSLNGGMTKWPYERTVLSSATADEGIVHNGPTRASLDQEQIGEISVLNETGQRYNYALPVYSRNERSLSYHFNATDHRSHWTAGPDNPESSSFKTGTETNASYATAFLLTSILTPDFVDRELDGPTPDDLGGYTRFTYSQHKHSGDPYFDWRMPYEGFSYSNDELSDCTDNRISFTGGEKQVYYLDKIITKTHEARFILGDRLDGLGGAGQTLKRLNRIELWAIGGTADQLVSTVHFDYDYDVWRDTPNSTHAQGRKLTLRKVWFEHNGIVPARISPYQFEYEYPTEAYPEPYVDLNMGTLDEDPPFSPFCTDPWGNYRSDGVRYEQYMPWLDQRIKDPLHDPQFDPAAHQLKRIILPSGGEIHIQYEQDDYAHVQNEKAHVMAAITGTTGNDVFRMDLEDVLSAEDIANGHTAETIGQAIRDFYQVAGRKIFFKTLYALTAGATDPLETTNLRWEYISGYASVEDVEVDDGTIEITLEHTGDHSLPVQVCNDLYNSEKRGKDLSQSCAAGVFSDHAVSSTGSSDPAQIIRSFVSFVGSAMAMPCHSIQTGMSYFRIPIGCRKLGGGVRVKRLLMLDQQGVSEGYPALFGSEYIYRTRDRSGRIISSGVATNEPGGLREENVLVRPLDRLHQSWGSKAVAGRDRVQSEGPLAESLYPGASVGYSQVIIRNIHQGITAPAFSVKEFLTAKDHPVRVESTSIDRPAQDHLPITTGIVDIVRTNAWASQGYTVFLNDMHGKPRAESSYQGTPEDYLSQAPCLLQASTRTDYFPLGQNLPIMKSAKGDIDPIGLPLGREQDVAIETRFMHDRMNDGNVEMDLGVGFFGIPFPTFSLLPTISHVSTSMSSHSITKVVGYPAVVQRTRVYKDGIHHVSENIAFDRNTGDPLIVRTHDGFYEGNVSSAPDLGDDDDGTYTSVSIPAAMIHRDMGQAAPGERRITVLVDPDDNLVQAACATVLSATGPKVVLEMGLSSAATYASPVSVSLCDLLGAMCTGDLFELKGDDGHLYFYRLEERDGTDLHLIAESYTPYPLGLTTSLVQLTTVRSGCDNKLKELAGSYTYYGQRSVTATDATGSDARRLFVQMLNNAVAGGDTELNPSEINANGTILFLGPDGNCGEALGIRVQKDGKNVSLDVDGLCNTTIDLGMGATGPGMPFGFDPDNGNIVFYRLGAECSPITVPCPQFCTPAYPTTRIANVVQSAATLHSDQWDYPIGEYGPWSTMTDLNDFELGKRGQWRALSNYAYLDRLHTGTTNRDQGLYTLYLLNWYDPIANRSKPWVMTDSITAYSPDGHALEEVDALGRPGCAKYGYDRMLPYLVAQNCWTGSVLFESFERNYTSPAHFEDQLPFSSTWASTGSLDATAAHSGKVSYKTSNASGLLFSGKTLTTRWPTINPERQRTAGYVVKAWIRSRTSSGISRTAENVTLNAVSSGSAPMHIVARTGEWVLYSAEMPVSPAVNSVTYTITCTNSDGSTTWIDDVRIQPVEARMTTYVYDPANFRLLATFDDQHFGLFYQYNAEGRLVRKMIETERGMRTMQETQYNSPGQPNVP